MTARPNARPTELLSAVVTHTQTLISKEIALAKAEISRNMSRAAIAVVLLLLALCLTFVAFNLLAGAGVTAAVALGLSPTMAVLAVAAIVLVVGAILALIAVKMLKNAQFAAQETAASIKQDFAALKDAFDEP